MRPLDLETSLCLLPCVGLFGCATVVDAPVVSLEPERASTRVAGWVEQGSSVEPLSLAQSAQRSARLELAQGNYLAAEAAVSFALEHESALAELHLTRAEAALALGEFERAESALDRYASESVLPFQEREAFEAHIENRRLDILERAHEQGSASCEAELDRGRRALERHAGFLSVFNELRAQMSSSEGLTIPLDDASARDELCTGLCEEDVNIVRLTGEQDSITGVLVWADDGQLFLLPELLHADTSSCEDDTHMAYELEGERLRVRVYSDNRGELLEPEEPPVEDWRLGIEAELGAIRAKVEAAGRTPSYYASSGYGSSGYGSSGYGSSGYGSSGYYSTGCGGGYDEEYDYDEYYGYCEVVRRVQRDTFIDLRRGEVVLDIVRTGPADAGLGRVTPEREAVSVSACGVEERLSLSWTAA